MDPQGCFVKQLHHPLALALRTTITNEMTHDRVPDHVITSTQNGLQKHTEIAPAKIVLSDPPANTSMIMVERICTCLCKIINFVKSLSYGIAENE